MRLGRDHAMADIHVAVLIEMRDSRDALWSRLVRRSISAYVSVATGTFLSSFLAVTFSASVNPILVTRHDHHEHTSRRLPTTYIDMSK